MTECIDKCLGGVGQYANRHGAGQRQITLGSGGIVVAQRLL